MPGSSVSIGNNRVTKKPTTCVSSTVARWHLPDDASIVLDENTTRLQRNSVFVVQAAGKGRLLMSPERPNDVTPFFHGKLSSTGGPNASVPACLADC